MIYLEHRIGVVVSEGRAPDDSKPLFRDMLAAIASATRFMRCLYYTNVWLSQGERDMLLTSGHEAIAAYKRCAAKCFEQGLARWKYQPKLHMFGEMLFQMEVEKRCNVPSISPLCWATQLDEDFVGRVSALSRAVSVRTVHTRTLSRYKIALAEQW